MTDDPLAHLYAETGAGDLDDDVELPARETSLDELTAERGAEPEELSDHDLDELVLLVGARLDAGKGLPDQDAAELGLGELVDDADGETELRLNEVGRAVLRRLLEQQHPGITLGWQAPTIEKPES